MVGTKMLLRTTLVSALVGGFMLFGSAAKTRADDRDNCYRNVQNWEQKLDRDIDRHGIYAGRPTTTDMNSARHARTANVASATTGETTSTPIVTATPIMIVTTTATDTDVGVILRSTKTA